MKRSVPGGAQEQKTTIAVPESFRQSDVPLQVFPIIASYMGPPQTFMPEAFAGQSSFESKIQTFDERIVELYDYVSQEESPLGGPSVELVGSVPPRIFQQMLDKAVRSSQKPEVYDLVRQIESIELPEEGKSDTEEVRAQKLETIWKRASKLLIVPEVQNVQRIHRILLIMRYHSNKGNQQYVPQMERMAYQIVSSPMKLTDIDATLCFGALFKFFEFSAGNLANKEHIRRMRSLLDLQRPRRLQGESIFFNFQDYRYRFPVEILGYLNASQVEEFFSAVELERQGVLQKCPEVRERDSFGNLLDCSFMEAIKALLVSYRFLYGNEGMPVEYMLQQARHFDPDLSQTRRSVRGLIIEAQKLRLL